MAIMIAVVVFIDMSLFLLLFLLPAVIQFFQQIKAGATQVFCVQIILFIAAQIFLLVIRI
jgi:hypothetical protein